MLSDEGLCEIVRVAPTYVVLVGRNRREFEVGPDELSSLASTRAPSLVACLPSAATLWNKLGREQRALVADRLGAVNEIETGYRSGHRAIRLQDEPRAPFDRERALTLSERCERWVELERVRVSHAHRNSPDLVKVPTARTVRRWVDEFRLRGLVGLIDGRSLKRTDGFGSVPDWYRTVAQDVVSRLDGENSRVDQKVLHTRIDANLRTGGQDPSGVPLRPRLEYVSFLARQQGSNTREQKSKKHRARSGFETFKATRPGQMVAIDVTRSDVLVWCPTQRRAVSVEIITAIDVATRMVLGLRVTPRSADAQDAALVLYDAIRPMAMHVRGTEVTDWVVGGVPERVILQLADAGADGEDLMAPLARDESTLQGTHQIPGVWPSAIRIDHGKIFKSELFTDVVRRLGIDLCFTRVGRPMDNAHVERLHGTYRNALQQLPGYKGSDTSERGRAVGTAKDDPHLYPTARELEEYLHRWIALDYHRRRHDGLRRPQAPDIDLSPIMMFDAMQAMAGRLSIPQRPDLLYDFLPVRWLTVGHAGVECKHLSYDCEEFTGLRDVPKGRFRDQDSAMPFFRDPHDVSRLWFRHPDDDRIVEVPCTVAWLFDAPPDGRDLGPREVDDRP